MQRLPEFDISELEAGHAAPTDANVARMWDAEIQRRLHEVESGSANLIVRRTFSNRLRELLERSAQVALQIQ
jgi:hypothetical protein